jgi:hypothetical protein
MRQAMTDDLGHAAAVGQNTLSFRNVGWRSAGWTLFARTWVAFAVPAFCVAAVAMPFDHPIWTSDDPYLAGAGVGTLCASYAFLYGLMEFFGASRRVRWAAYFGPMAALVALLIGVDLFIPSSEGHGIPTITAVVTLLGSIGALPLVAFRLPKAVVALATVLGFLYFIGFAIMLFARASR